MHFSKCTHFKYKKPHTYQLSATGPSKKEDVSEPCVKGLSRAAIASLSTIKGLNEGKEGVDSKVAGTVDVWDALE